MIESAAEFDDVDEVVDPALRYPARNEPIQLWDRSNWHQGRSRLRRLPRN
ncbi:MULTISPECIES: hypothetical protein [Corynebacterium]|uniref:Uncharacterized protein n=1 Tax=Corynebacterium freneyi TaxID=134034 RepID=A0ABS4U5Z2_9CORY|nr:MULTISPECIES: hypothetical protein [Corynebacterium]MBP2332057.1 hypothetical protein [Corynebacterium freneyi]MCG7438306.1 hypothetical protein [Corynebacterium freneyi]QXA53703.1 hypothetical protein I6L56_04970 [Corynebacterium freneyi]UBI01755.1 hypothetical protein LA334_09570 [Corynebacterium freneyi]